MCSGVQQVIFSLTCHSKSCLPTDIPSYFHDNMSLYFLRSESKIQLHNSFATLSFAPSPSILNILPGSKFVFLLSPLLYLSTASNTSFLRIIFPSFSFFIFFFLYFSFFPSLFNSFHTFFSFLISRLSWCSNPHISLPLVPDHQTIE